MTSESPARMSKEARQKARLARKSNNIKDGKQLVGQMPGVKMNDKRFAELLVKNEDELINFVVLVNKVYQEKLNKNAPFMTFVFCGMQSAGKSTIMERFMNAVINIVQEGTGTRCPLDTTCIHDEKCVTPKCELSGIDLDEAGKDLTVEDVFGRITRHNKKLGEEDRFSTEPLRLIYRAKSVQNIRFVDTPGIISTQSVGRDNREDIKKILRSEMCKPNTKLCVLLEPKEFATNPIIDFCDQTFGKREWIPKATFLMTKFDKQLEDSRTASKANNFFKEFHANEIFPHLVITPTLRKEDIPTKELYKARVELLDSANEDESNRFGKWHSEHQLFQQEINAGEEETLREEIRSRVSFTSAKDEMRSIMLADTAERLPTVLNALRKELTDRQREEQILLHQQKFSDPVYLREVAFMMWVDIRRRITNYLDGDLASSIKYPDKLQTLEEEIFEEENSEWSSKDLNQLTCAEDDWRTSIANLGGEYPECVRAEERYFGGKQVQRAIEFFRAVMIEELPDPYKLKDQVANATGYLADGLQRENWERGMTQVATTCLKNGSPPGINFLFKHVGHIYRRLFIVALDDVKHGEHYSIEFKLLPSAVEKHLVRGFDEMLWSLLVNAAKDTHKALEPKYSTVDPTLLNLSCNEDEENWKQNMTDRLEAFASFTAEACKNFLRKESQSQSLKRNILLPDDRSAMITEAEIKKILARTFEYIFALMDFILKDIKFQVNHYLIVQFKKELETSFTAKLINEPDWVKMVEDDPEVSERLAKLKDEITGLSESLDEVKRLQNLF